MQIFIGKTYTDELFDIDSSDSTKIVFPYSRVFCDVERFNDERESMLKYGQGVVYSHGINGKKFRDISKKTYDDIIKNYYDVHSSLVREKVVQSKNPILIDCHSFSNETYRCTPFTSDVSDLYPDICMGFNGDKKSEQLALLLVNYWQKVGLTVAMNTPYAGTYQIDRFPAVMIEVNKRLYLENDYLTKKRDFSKVRDWIVNAIALVEKFT